MSKHTIVPDLGELSVWPIFFWYKWCTPVCVCCERVRAKTNAPNDILSWRGNNRTKITVRHEYSSVGYVKRCRSVYLFFADARVFSWVVCSYHNIIMTIREDISPSEMSSFLNNRSITIKVSEMNRVIRFKIGVDSRLVKLMTYYCNKNALSLYKTRFTFGHRRIGILDTASSMGINEGDTIKVIREQSR